MSLSRDDWELVLEGMSECPKCGGESGVYTRALIGETTTRLFGCVDVNDCEHFVIRGGTVFYCIDCDRPLFDSDGKTR